MNRSQSRPTPTLVSDRKNQPVDTAADQEPIYLWALIVGLGVGLLYAVTLAPTTAYWDTSEYIATGHILGIPHPPGNPLFVLMARTWDLLLAPLGLSVATRINLFSALMGSVAHGLWFLAVHHILSFFSDDRRFRIVGAIAAVLVSATAFTVWNQSNVNEKVYTVSLMTIALLTWLAFHWRENLGKGRDDNLLVLIAFILALSVGNHLMAFLAAPALVLFILWVSPGVLLNWRLYAVGAFAIFLGLSIHLFLPIRAALGPIINEADPTCSSLRSALTSIMTMGQAGCTELSAALSRQQYLKPPMIPRASPLWSQFANYLQYFDWQWARGAAGTGAETVFPLARLPFTFVFASLGLYGAVQHLRRDSATGLYVLALFATLSIGLVFYLNFPYGFSLASPSPDDIHEVRERDYFFIVSFSVWVSGRESESPHSATGRRTSQGLVVPSCAGARTGSDPARVQLAVGEPPDGLLRTRLGVQPLDERGTIQHSFYQRRQRHVSALVLAGGRGYTPRRDRHRHLLLQSGLVRLNRFETSRPPAHRVSRRVTAEPPSFASDRTTPWRVNPSIPPTRAPQTRRDGWPSSLRVR